MQKPTLFEQTVSRGRSLADGECWHWVGKLRPNGYALCGRPGTHRRGRGMIWAHRLAYETLVGPVPAGWHVHHTCSEPSCINPAHLQAMPAAEHYARGPDKYRGRTTCGRGHSYTPDNTIRIKSDGKWYRACKTCHRAACRKASERYRARRHGHGTRSFAPT